MHANIREYAWVWIIVLGGLVMGQHNIVREYLIPSIGSTRCAGILLVYLWVLGGLLGIWNRNGGADLHSGRAVGYVMTPRRCATYPYPCYVVI